MEDLIGLIFIAVIWLLRTIASANRRKKEEQEAPPQTNEQQPEESMRDIWEEIFGEEAAQEESGSGEPTVQEESPAETRHGERPRMEEVVREKTVQPSRPKPTPYEKPGSQQPRYEVPKRLEPSYKEGMSFEDFVAEARRDRQKKATIKPNTSSNYRIKKDKKRQLLGKFDLRQAVINDAVLNRPYK